MKLISVLQQRGHKPCLECEENDCELKMKGIKNYAIIRDETIKERGRKADCLIFHDGDPLNLVVCELKSYNVNQKRIIEQISSGVNYATTILEAIQPCKIPNIILVVLLKSKIKPSSVSRLRKAGISAYNHPHPIFALQCGSHFSDIIKLVG